MNVGYDNILTSTLHVVTLREIIAVAAADTQQFQLPYQHCKCRCAADC